MGDTFNIKNQSPAPSPLLRGYVVFLSILVGWLRQGGFLSLSLLVSSLTLREKLVSRRSHLCWLVPITPRIRESTSSEVCVMAYVVVCFDYDKALFFFSSGQNRKAPSRAEPFIGELSGVAAIIPVARPTIAHKRV